MITKDNRSHDDVLAFRFSGEVTKSDYATFVPEVDRAIGEFVRVKILIVFDNFEGWDLGAMWSDLRFTEKHYSSVERFAVVGAARWQKVLVTLAKPFTAAQVKWFDAGDEAAAWTWLESEAKTTANATAQH